MAQLVGPSFGPTAGGPPCQLVVLLHGVGADGQDLIGLAPLLAELLPHARFVAPDGPQPCDLAPYGRQWFSLQDRRPASMLAGAERTLPALDAWLDGDRYYALSGGTPGSGKPPTLFRSSDLRHWDYLGRFMTRELPEAQREAVHARVMAILAEAAR